VQAFYHLLISVLPLEIQLPKGERVRIPLTGLTCHMLCLSKPGPKFPKPYVNFGYRYKLKFKLLLSNLEFVENVTMQVIN
jgi:hypothetical protein